MHRLLGDVHLALANPGGAAKLGLVEVRTFTAFIVLASLAGGSPTVAGEPSATTQPDSDDSDIAEKETKPPLREPTYMDLRYDEDFSYLDGPEGSYAKDFFDPIKWIRITDDLTLSIGGEARGRIESETNKGFGATEPAQDTFFLHRYFLHADLKYRKQARLFIEGVNAMVEDRDLAPRAFDENRFDVHQLFLDVRPLGDDTPLTLRVGRQELEYGRARLIGIREFPNTRQRFDGVKLMAESEKFDLDFFYMRFIPLDLTEGLNRKPDEYREEQHFYGVYGKYKGIKNHYFEPYFLALRDRGDLVNANQRAGDLSLYTMGGRLGGETGPFDYDGELAGQWGKFAGDTVQAWMAAVDAGWTLQDVPWTPRLGAGFDYASGDEDPFDGNHQTFNQLFPRGHPHLGYLDLFGRQNIMATNINLSFDPMEKVTTRLAWYTFWADEVRGATCNPGGGAGRRNVAGNAGHDIGNEFDLTVTYALDRHSSFLFGYSHFWSNNFIRATGPDRDADFIYFQYRFRF